jgi:ribose transport system permease protein
MTETAIRTGHPLAARLAAVPGVAWILFALVATFAVAAKGFLSPANLANIGLQSAILLMLAAPMTLIIMTEGIDISMGAVLGLCGVSLALVLAKGGGLPAAIVVAVAVGLAFGLVNGLLVAVVDMPPFVATLGTLGIAHGLALAVTDGQSVVGIGDAIQALYRGATLGLPNPVLLAAAAYGLTHVLLYHTRFGVAVFALGGNREALTLAGVRARLYLVATYAFGGLMIGLASLLLTARMNAGHPTAAIGMEFDAVVAVAVGGTSFERGDGWLLGTLLGVIAVGVLRNGLNLLGIPSSLQVVSIGLLVIVALLIDSLKRGR